MSILQLLLLFIGGMTVLLIASRLLLAVAKTLAWRWKISPLFAALILVALGANIPELSFTINSLLGGDVGLAMGNVVGSNITNLLLVFGVGVLISRPRIGNSKTPKNVLLMLVVTLFFIVVRTLGLPFVLQGILLLSITFLIFCYEYLLTVQGREREDKKYFLEVAKPKQQRRSLQKLPVRLLLLVVLGALIGTAAGAYLVISAVSGLAIAFHLSQTVLGLTIVAIATSMPELVTTILASQQKDDKVMVGTIVGSNVYNIGLSAGLLLLRQTETYVSNLDLLFLVGSAFLFTFLVLIYTGKNVHRGWGALLIGLFLVFVAQAYLLPFLPV